MKRSNKTSISLSDDEQAILDSIASRKGITRSDVVRHLLLYQGLVGGDFPLTTKIFDLPSKDQERIIAEIRRKTELDDPPKPQAFRQWIKDILGRDDPQAMERGAGVLLRELLSGG